VTTDPEHDRGARPKRQPAELPHCAQCGRTTGPPNERDRTEARGIPSSIHRRAAPPARCNTPAGARATFARGLRPTANRSWPAPDASALGRCAC
jgi:hypothetical protein